MKRVLIVDDNLVNRQLLLGMLQHYESENSGIEFKIVEAENGKKAVECAASEQFDIIFMDIMMPVMDGFELCKSIKSDEKIKN